MLVLTRKLGQRFVVGDTITVTVLQVESGKVRLGIQAPAHVRILREELQACSPECVSSVPANGAGR